jgi:uncharacterized protein (TIRG00374 family)
MADAAADRQNARADKPRRAFWLSGPWRSLLLGSAVTAIFAALVLSTIDPQAALGALERARWQPLILGAACVYAGYLLRILRWKVILRPLRDIPVRTLTPALFLGFAVNNLLPARVGELARARALARDANLETTVVLASVLLERFFDGCTLVILLGISALLVPLPSAVHRVGAAAGIVFGAAAVVIFLIGPRASNFAERAVDALLPPRASEPIARGIGLFFSGLRLAHGSRRAANIAARSILVWIVEMASYACVLWSLGPPEARTSPLLAALIMMTLVNLGSIVPTAPGYLGAYQFFGVLALRATGVSDGAALAAAIAAHVIQWTTVTLVGLIFLARRRGF